MRVLLVSRDFSGACLARQLQREGHEVRAHVALPEYERVMLGMVERVDGVEQGLGWAGREGLIVFDDVGFGQLQDDLRRDGFRVVGGSAGGERLELDRQFAQDLFASLGMQTLPSRHFAGTAPAAAWVRANPGRWVVKQNGHADKGLCYVGRLADGADVIDVLEHYGRRAADDCRSLDVQAAVDGVEFAVTRYFDGVGWAGPIMPNQEHKDLCVGDLGPKTYEMGTLMWFAEEAGNRLFQETLAPLAGYLRNAEFRGCVDVNSIVNGDGVFPLEVTARFGYPALQLEMALLRSSWGEFLGAIADGTRRPVSCREGFGVVVLLAAPPFPYRTADGRQSDSSKGLKIHLRAPLAAEEEARLHFEDVEAVPGPDGRPEPRLCTHSGYAVHVTGAGATVEEARREAYALAGKVMIPKMYFRPDIGKRFLARDRAQLRGWGYL